MRSRIPTLVGALLVLGWVWEPKAAQLRVARERDGLYVAEGARVGGFAAPKTAPHASNHGSTLAADSQGLWIAECTTGSLIRADLEGRPIAITSHSGQLGELIRDERSGMLFLADRGGDRVLRFDTSTGTATSTGELVVSEPYGLALTPDGSTLLVTSVAEHELVAIDTSTMAARWRVELAPEPRAVAVAPDGSHALVGFLSSGALARIELSSQANSITWQSLSPRDEVGFASLDIKGYEFEAPALEEAGSRFQVPNDIGRRHARNLFALAFVGDGIAIAAHQRATPQIELVPDPSRRDSYGGGDSSVPPIEHWIARIGEPGRDGSPALAFGELEIHQPRSLAYDATNDVLFVGGYGDDKVVAIAEISRAAPSLLWTADLGEGLACGVDALALAADGAGLWVHCELARRVVNIGFDASPSKWLRGPELMPAARSEKVERGAELFRRGGDRSISTKGVLACASCHPEGRSDGLSWRLGKSILQTPMLTGRVIETAPYKWDGQDETMTTSIDHTIARIGGEGLPHYELLAIAAYLDSLPAAEPPTVTDAQALERGRVVFERECVACHADEHATDRSQHALTTTLPVVDTPSLHGLAHTAPYYHDGSAIDLATLLDDRGSIHDMTDTSKLSPDERADLIVYLESL
jgi:mono/diheme cytochrome c family protein